MHSNTNQHYKRKLTQKGEIEKLIFTRLLIVFGLLFLISGLYLFFSSSNLSVYILNSIQSLLKPSIEHTKSIYSFNSSLNITLLLYFIPAISILIASLYFAGKYRVTSFILITIVSMYFIFIQVRLFINTYSGGCSYDNNLIIAVFFLIITAMLLVKAALIYGNFFFSALTCLYFYFSTLLYVLSIDGHEVLFVLIILFSIVIILMGEKIKQPQINLVNYLLATGFFSIYFFKKIIINSELEFLPIFFIFGGLYYVLFYLIPVFSSGSEDKPLSKWMQSLLGSSNLLFYVGTTSLVLLKFYNYSSLCFFVPVLLLVNITGAYLIKKRVQHVWALPYDFAVIFLASLILPVWIQDSVILLFMGIFSILMLKYSIKKEGKTGFWISTTTLLFCVLGYILDTLGLVPVMIYDHKTPQIYLLLIAILNSMFLLGVLWGTRSMVKDAVLPVDEKKWTSRKYVKLIDASLLSFLFVTVGLIIFLIPYLITGSVRYLRLSWFISGSLFFIYFIRYFTGKRLALKKPTQYAAFLFVLIYPFLTTISLLNVNSAKLVTCDIIAILLHYSSLVLFVVLSIMAISRIIKRNKTNNFNLRGIRLVVVIYLLFIAFVEYNNLSMFVAFLTHQYTAFEPDSLFISSNFYFPFTILLALYASGVNIYAIVKHDTFLRIVSVVLIVLAIIKLFLLDKGTVKEDAFGTIFIAAGIFLVLLALINSWVLNKISKSSSSQ